MSLWSKIGKVTGAVTGGVVGFAVMSKISGNKNKRDNTEFLSQLQFNPNMQQYVAARAPGGLSAVFGMTEGEVSRLRHDWEKSPAKRLVQP